MSLSRQALTSLCQYFSAWLLHTAMLFRMVSICMELTRNSNISCYNRHFQKKTR